MRIVSIILILLIGGVFVASAMAGALKPPREARTRRMLHVLFAFFIAYGGLAFFGQALGSTGALSFLGPSFEWPMGYVRGVVRDSAGRYTAAHCPAGRIQVYDKRGHFVNGWFVESGGGEVKLHITEDDDVEVFTARGQKRLLFATDGTLLKEGTYSPTPFDDLPADPTIAMTFETPWLLWPFTHPFIGWALVFSGILGLLVLDRKKRHRNAAA